MSVVPGLEGVEVLAHDGEHVTIPAVIQAAPGDVLQQGWGSRPHGELWWEEGMPNRTLNHSLPLSEYAVPIHT